jgi:hypothetical protein
MKMEKNTSYIFLGHVKKVLHHLLCIISIAFPCEIERLVPEPESHLWHADVEDKKVKSLCLTN